ncbi:MAG: S-adenosylmethionine decarboxylase [Candidatus Saccharibacteria bacterium]|nr:S-adenosylmethionine decarboxylase [Candidatus Saccharibacteria bacterium]
MNPAIVQSITIRASGASPALLNNAVKLEQLLRTIADAAGLHPLESVTHQFSPQGVSTALLLSESHVALHAWPEHAMAYITLTTCAPLEEATLLRIQGLIAEALAATDIAAKEVVV